MKLFFSQISSAFAALYPKNSLGKLAKWKQQMKWLRSQLKVSWWCMAMCVFKLCYFHTEVKPMVGCTNSNPCNCSSMWPVWFWYITVQLFCPLLHKWGVHVCVCVNICTNLNLSNPTRPFVVPSSGNKSKGTVPSVQQYLWRHSFIAAWLDAEWISMKPLAQHTKPVDPSNWG